uniref:Uncharacterized protein n=1 Tax=Brassica campestris TaxID=3711 RepID=M4ED00_BRACM
MTEVEEFKSKLPKDELCLAIVESKPVGQVVGVSDKDDFFVHTPRKTIAELSESRQVPRLCLGSSTSALSEAPEGSLMLSAGSSEEVNPSELTPAKRTVATIVNLEEDFDRNSVTKTACTVRVKKEKSEKSG